MTKRILSLLMFAVVCTALFASCSDNDDSSGPISNPPYYLKVSIDSDFVPVFVAGEEQTFRINTNTAEMEITEFPAGWDAFISSDEEGYLLFVKAPSIGAYDETGKIILTAYDVVDRTSVVEFDVTMQDYSLVFENEVLENIIKEDYSELLYSDGNVSARLASTYTETLRLSNLTSLNGIEFFPSITGLVLQNSELTNIEVTKNLKLTRFRCWACNVSSLNVKNLKALEVLDCVDNNLSSLDVSENTELEYLSCEENKLVELDLKNNPKLIVLEAGNNKLTQIDIRNSLNLERFTCNNQDIAEDANTIITVWADFDPQNLPDDHFWAYDLDKVSFYNVSE